jgi:tRNA A-37 threonylcarbamoyl transferase component Bud32/tetratricopeptide (TPR) repeat protein
MSELLEQLKTALADRYQIESEIGSGGMAVVYRATDLKHDRRVALKVMRPEISASLGSDRFLREIRIAARLTHPHIVPLYDSGEAAGLLYYVMPFIEGDSLRDRLNRTGPMEINDALQIMREAGSALSHAHTQGIVHRDIKPGNIMLSGGHAVVADFGIARAVTEAGGESLTRTGVSVGTPDYMSPEQASGRQPVDARSDEYSLACVLYEMLVGQPPFTGPTPMAVMARHSLDPVPSVRTLRSTIPAGLEESVNRALSKMPADRFKTVEQFVEAVTGEQAAAAGSARGVGAGPQGSLLRKLAWVGLGASVATGAVLVGLKVDLSAVFAPDEEELVAVLDFESLVPDSLEYLTRAIPEFLATAMTGETGGPRALGRRLVRRTWDEVLGTTADPQARYERAAAALGATHVLRGEVIHQPDGGVRVRAELLRGREIVTEAVAIAQSGDAIAVSEALGVQLLAGSAGEFHRLSGLATSSTATVQQWLRGTEAFRDGRYEEAVTAYSAALDEDSTFALAAWGLMNSAMWLEDAGGGLGRGLRLAWQHRGRLPPADSAIFVAESQRGGYPEPLPAGELGALRLFERAVQLYPERWDAWFRYADFLWHEGGAYVDEGRPLAVQAFQRALALDTAGHDEIWQHLFEHYVLTGNSEAFRALPPQHQNRAAGAVLTLMDPTRELDSSEREWHEELYQGPIHGLMDLQAAGAAMAEAERLASILEQRAEDGDPNSAQVAGVFAMNRGRPSHAARLLRLAEEPSPVCGGGICQLTEQWLQSAVFAEGMAEIVGPMRDSLEAGWAHVRIEDIASDDRDMRIAAGEMLYYGFWIAVWDMMEGDSAGARANLALARRVPELSERAYLIRVSGVVTSFLEALLAADSDAPSAKQAVAAADSVYAMGGMDRSTIALQVLLSQLYHRVGDDEKALRVLQRVWMRGGEEYVWFLSDRLLSRARLAADLGYRDEAIQSYEHYLTLMSNPEPVLEETVAGVGAELEALRGD